MPLICEFWVGRGEIINTMDNLSTITERASFAICSVIYSGYPKVS